MNKTNLNKCTSTTRDKYNHCVECGVEIFAGDARIKIIDENGAITEFNRYVVGHVN